MAIGISIPKQLSNPNGHLAEGYETISVNPKDYKGKKVLIFGNGNSGFEVADSIYPYANFVHVLGHHPHRLAWDTHYVGDLRGVNNAMLDTFFLKSLDGISSTDTDDTGLRQKDGRFWTYHVDATKYSTRDDPHLAGDNADLREPYDKVIRCTGFVFDRSLFNSSAQPAYFKLVLKKYPKIRYNHEVTNVPGMFIAGTAAHSIDHRKAAGGFIHGFRYTTRSLHNMLEWRNHRVPWPAATLTSDQLLTYLLKRINEASGIYQMFGVLGDLINIKSNGLIEYMEEIPLDLVHKFEWLGGRKLERVIVLVMQYGANKTTDVPEPVHAHKSYFLHPVLYHYKELPTKEAMTNREAPWVLPRPHRIHHVVEDFITSWDAPLSHILPLRRFLEFCLNLDLRHFPAKSCFEMTLKGVKTAETCQMHYMQGNGLDLMPDDINLQNYITTASVI